MTASTSLTAETTTSGVDAPANSRTVSGAEEDLPIQLAGDTSISSPPMYYVYEDDSPSKNFTYIELDQSQTQALSVAESPESFKARSPPRSPARRPRGIFKVEVNKSGFRILSVDQGLGFGERMKIHTAGRGGSLAVDDQHHQQNKHRNKGQQGAGAVRRRAGAGAGAPGSPSLADLSRGGALSAPNGLNEGGLQHQMWQHHQHPHQHRHRDFTLKGRSVGRRSSLSLQRRMNSAEGESTSKNLQRRLGESMPLKTAASQEISDVPWSHLTRSCMTPRGKSRHITVPYATREMPYPHPDRIFEGTVMSVAGASGQRYLECEEEGGEYLMNLGFNSAKARADLPVGARVSFKLQPAPTMSGAVRAGFKLSGGGGQAKACYDLGTIVQGEKPRLRGAFVAVKSDHGSIIWVNMVQRSARLLKSGAYNRMQPGTCIDFAEAEIVNKRSPAAGHVVAQLSGSGILVLIDARSCPALCGICQRHFEGEYVPQFRQTVMVRCRYLGLVSHSERQALNWDNTMIDMSVSKSGEVIGEVTGVWERQGVVCMSSSIGAIETVVDFVDADADIQIGQFVRLRFELTEAWLIEYNNRAKNMKPPATPRRRVAVKGTPADQCFVAEGRIAYETIVNEVISPGTKHKEGSQPPMSIMALVPNHHELAVVHNPRCPGQLCHIQIGDRHFMCKVRDGGVKGLEPGCYAAVQFCLIQRSEPVLAEALAFGEHRNVDDDGTDGPKDGDDDGDGGVGGGVGDDADGGDGGSGLGLSYMMPENGMGARPLWNVSTRVAYAVTVQPEASKGSWNGKWHGGVVSSWQPHNGEGRAESFVTGEKVHLNVANFEKGQNLLAITAGVRLQFAVLLDDQGRLQAARVEIVNRAERDALAQSLPRPSTAALMGSTRVWESSKYGITTVLPDDGSQTERQRGKKAGRVLRLSTAVSASGSITSRRPGALVAQEASTFPLPRSGSVISISSASLSRPGTSHRPMGQPIFQPDKAGLGVDGYTPAYEGT